MSLEYRELKEHRKHGDVGLPVSCYRIQPPMRTSGSWNAIGMTKWSSSRWNGARFKSSAATIILKRGRVIWSFSTAEASRRPALGRGGDGLFSHCVQP